jgi:hypothetical protein
VRRSRGLSAAAGAGVRVIQPTPGLLVGPAGNGKARPWRGRAWAGINDRIVGRPQVWLRCPGAMHRGGIRRRQQSDRQAQGEKRGKNGTHRNCSNQRIDVNDPRFALPVRATCVEGSGGASTGLCASRDHFNEPHRAKNHCRLLIMWCGRPFPKPERLHDRSNRRNHAAAVVPAKAGIHNHRRSLLARYQPAASSRQTTSWGYGSRLCAPSGAWPGRRGLLRRELHLGGGHAGVPALA